ncbi:MULTISPECIES: hypothetical protein [unclassified Acinetobacter]|uniref:hypothetical protein n=1 Tax=unclassified Acinetobacter TaxID=196816 RepID=UPI0035BB1F1B
MYQSTHFYLQVVAMVDWLVGFSIKLCYGNDTRDAKSSVSMDTVIAVKSSSWSRQHVKQNA